MLLILLAVLAYAQPTLKFKGFNGEYVDFGRRKGSGREFVMRVNQSPFHFEAKGVIDAGMLTNDLDIMLDDVVAVLSYFEQGHTINGKAVETGLNDLLFYAEDESCKITELKITLLPPISNDKKAKTLLAAVPNLLKEYEPNPTAESSAIIRASADPWSKSYMEAEQLEAEKRMAQQKAEEERILAAQKAEEQKRAQAAQAAQKRAKEKEERDRRAAERERQRSAQKKQKRPAPPPVEEYSQVDDYEDYGAAEAYTDVPTRKSTKKSGSFLGMGEMETGQKIGVGFVGVGVVATIYGILQHMDYGKKNTALNELANDPIFMVDPQAFRSWPTRDGVTPWHAGQPGKSYDTIEREKLGHGSNRNLGLVLAAALIGGGIVMINF